MKFLHVLRDLLLNARARAVDLVTIRSAAPMKFLGVQYARAVAALGVLIFHAAQRSGVDFTVGARGVDLFFVISGFIMWTASSRKTVSPIEFVLARLKRIVPLYWIATTSLAIGAILGLFPTLREELTWPHYLQSLLFVPHVSPGSGQIWPVLVPGWTLNLEMFFYLSFAACLLVSPRRRLAGLTTAFAALVVVGLAFSPTGAIAITYTSPLILEFIGGMWIGALVLRSPPPRAALSIALGLAGLVGLLSVPHWGGVAERAACLASASMCIYGVVCLDLRRGTPYFGFLKLVGDASYSIYLWHGVAVSIVAALTYRLGLPLFVIIPASIAGGLVMGLMSYVLLERPTSRILANVGARSNPG